MSNDPTFTGYRFLLNTSDSREYAIRYEGDKAKAIDVYAEDVRDGGFEPGEVAFALDDNKQLGFKNGALVVSTSLFQISVSDAGKKNIKSAPVDYEVSVFPSALGGAFVLSYKMTAETAKAATQAGINIATVGRFTDKLDPNDGGLVPNQFGQPSLDPEFLKQVSFPPCHAFPLAMVARQNVDQTKKQDTKAAPAFNENSDPAPVREPKKNYKVNDAAIKAALKQFCTDLTDQAVNGKLDPVVGRDVETDQALKVLTRRKQASLCFTGEAGVGKTAMFTAVAQRLADEGEPARVFLLDLQAMNAGATFRGQFEGKLKPLIDGLAEREGMLNGQKIIIAIDEIHSQLTAGMAQGGTDSANMMKPFFVAKGISVMGTTTGEEYKKHIEKDPALASRFEQMVLAQPDAVATKQILERLWPLYKEHHKIAEDLADEDFDYIVEMTNRYAPNEAQPRKGEKVLDMAGASAKFRGSKVIEREDIISAVAQMSKLSVDFLSQKDNERFLKMEEELPKDVLGQPGVQKFVDGLVGARSGLNDPNQPWGAFVFQGPTGTGKTELCKAAARYLFGTDAALIQLNMGEFAQEHTVSRLIGAPPGFVGFDTAEPALTEKIRQRPYSILLLDEIEKAHPKVFDVLLPILNDGKMDDNQGKTVLFNNVIVVMTTNMGATEAMNRLEGRGGVDFGGSSSAKNQDPVKIQEDLAKIYAKARDGSQGGFFRPELINRLEELGGFVTFVPLTTQVIDKLVDREIAKVEKRLSTSAGAALKKVELEVSPEIRAQLSKEGYSKTMGARPLRKVIREKVANPLGKWLMGNKDSMIAFAKENGGARLVIDKVGKDMSPRLEPPAAPSNDNVLALPKPQSVNAPKP